MKESTHKVSLSPPNTKASRGRPLAGSSKRLLKFIAAVTSEDSAKLLKPMSPRLLLVLNLLHVAVKQKPERSTTSLGGWAPVQQILQQLLRLDS